MVIILIIWMIFQSVQEAPKIEVYQVERNGYIQIWAKNPHIYPVTIELSAKLENLSSDKTIPLTDVLPPNSDRILVHLNQINRRNGWNFETTFATYMGDVNAQHLDEFAYQFPYRIGSRHTVSQAYNGTFSHTGRSAYSIDFTMPEGTQVYAARDGIVIDVVQHFKNGKSDESYADQANYIAILHSDGTIADYSHLQYNGARVSIGDEIRIGQFIGFSGSTGFVTGPHLHFSVKKTVLGGSYETIPIKFATPEGPLTPRQGRSYTAY